MVNYIGHKPEFFALKIWVVQKKILYLYKNPEVGDLSKLFHRPLIT